MDQTIPAWKRMRFKTSKVWLATDCEGNPIIRNNKVLIKYQLDQAHAYWVHPARIGPLEPQAQAASPQAPAGSADGSEISRKGPTGKDSLQPTVRNLPSAPAARKRAPQSASAHDHQTEVEENAVCLFTDGASSGNPGPSGIGVVMRYGSRIKEISRPIGLATNNIAELEAIRAGLMEIKKTDLPVRVFTDSSYAHGVLVLGWKAKKNRELISSIQKLIAAFRDIRFIKVKGHSGMVENERADFLATRALRCDGSPDA